MNPESERALPMEDEVITTTEPMALMHGKGCLAGPPPGQGEIVPESESLSGPRLELLTASEPMAVVDGKGCVTGRPAGQ